MIAAALLACAMHMAAPSTIQAIIENEGQGNPLAIHDNTRQVTIPAADREAAVMVATKLVAQGDSVDLGLMQVNSNNLPSLGMTVAEAFDPCANIHAGVTILAGYYRAAERIYGPGQRALQAALSAYNTGDFQRGFRNGYVARYYGGAVMKAAAASPPEPDPYTAALTATTDVYDRISVNAPIS